MQMNPPHESGSKGAWQRWFSPAKLNLGLRILGRREDGYHLLQTIFQLIDFGDDIHLRKRADGRIERLSELPGVAAGDDLAVRAACALQRASACPLGVDLHLTKRIPMGAGLGGGSSNAGTVLRALNRLWQLHYGADELARIGATLGADVPVFALGVSALGEGIGNRLTPLVLPSRRFIVIFPESKVPTAAIFADPRLTRNSAPSTIPSLLSDASWVNDCEAVVAARVPEVARALRWLREIGAAHLTGTGGAVFAQVEDQSIAEQRLASLPAGWRGWLASSLNHAPDGFEDNVFSVGTSPSW